MPKKKRRPSRPKLQNPVEDARRNLRSGAYRDTIHYETRRGERGVTQDEVMQVIETGRHEKRKDEYKEEYRAWNYAIRGETLDGRTLRVVVSFERVYGKELMVLVTAIDLGRSS